MVNGFSNMFAKNILLILILSNMFNVDGYMFRKKKCDYSSDWLEEVTVIVTGSNSGIGEATALEFYKMGREFGSLEYHNLDLSDLNSVRVSAEKLLGRTKDIQILVNNAGVFTKDKSRSKNDYEIHLAVNHLGPFLFTLLLLSRIQESVTARIINVSSEEYKWCDQKMHLDDINLEQTNFNSKQTYGRSKLANLLFTTELAKRLNAVKDNKVAVFAVFPDPTNTNISRITLLYKNIFKILKMEDKVAAQTILYCALNSECVNHSGSYYKNCKKMEPNPNVITEITSKELYDRSCKLVNLTEEEDPFNPKKH